MIHREHIFQKHLKIWVRENLPLSQFFAFDRTKALGKFSHARQKAHGIRKGTPDCVLLMPGKPDVWCELKAPGKRPDEDQEAIGSDIIATGRIWFWTTSVAGYLNTLEAKGIVPRDARLRWAAENHDVRIQVELERAQIKAGKLPKRFKESKPRVSPGRIAKAHKAGVWAR